MPNDTSKIKINYKTELEVHSDTFIQQSKSHLNHMLNLFRDQLTSNSCTTRK